MDLNTVRTLQHGARFWIRSRYSDGNRTKSWMESICFE